MKDNSERDIPYVSKGLCEYLRERFSLPNLMSLTSSTSNDARTIGAFKGIDTVIGALEEIQIMQEERDGIRG